MSAELPHPPRRLPLFLLRAAAPAGVLVSLLLVRQYIRFELGQGLDSRLCRVVGIFNCEAVEASGYTSWFGVPIASLGVFYFFLLSLGAWLGSPGTGEDSRRRWQGLFALATVPGVAFAWGLAMLSVLAIRFFCLGCTAIYAVVLVCAIAPIWIEPRHYLNSLRAAPVQALGLIAGALRKGTAGRARNILLAASLLLLAVLNFGYPAWAVRHASSANALDAYLRQPVVELNPTRPGLTQGPPDAPIRVVVFTDFACPFCAEFSRMLPPLLEAYAGRVQLGFKHYPLARECNPIMKEAAFDHPRACRLAQMAEVLAETGRFHDLADRLYIAGEVDLYPLLKTVSDEAGIDYAAWAARSSHTAIRRHVEEDIEEGVALGIRALPAVFINGRYVPTLSAASIGAILRSLESGTR